MAKTCDIFMLGGSGFVGRHLAAELSRRGHRVRVLTRHEERCRELKVLPTVWVDQGDPYDPSTLAAELEGCDLAINLVGILNETGHPREDFRSAHVELPRLLAEACRRNHVRHVLHMSALGADASRAPSRYLRTKGEGEAQYRQHGGERLQATIFRPSVIFGPGDSFINRFVGLLRWSPAVFPLACPDSRYAPVYVGDVARAFADSVSNRDVPGKSFCLCGPRTYTLREIVEYTARTAGLKRRIVSLGDGMSHAQGKLMQHFPGKPFTEDNYLSTRVDSVCQQNDLERFGIRPTPMEAVVPVYVGHRRTRDRYPDYRRMVHDPNLEPPSAVHEPER
ncbi:MAG TPA: NAD-dependent epimerase/dehydratase family protein [Gammaproteobacteria bacterium]|nr:NAD-dependent epimerase/dehydratase family protein [Gammaproteobacteria bacterium]